MVCLSEVAGSWCLLLAESFRLNRLPGAPAACCLVLQSKRARSPRHSLAATPRDQTFHLRTAPWPTSLMLPALEVSQCVVTLRPGTIQPTLPRTCRQARVEKIALAEHAARNFEFGVRRDQLVWGVKQARCHGRRARLGAKENLLEARVFPEKSRELFCAQSVAIFARGKRDFHHFRE